MPAKFSSSQVGAYCIRPIGRHPTDGECANRANYHDSSFHKWNVCRAYAIRPYMETPKRGAFCTSYLVATPKRGAFCTSYLVATPKRGAFCTSYLVGTPKRGTFCTSYLVGSLKDDAFCLFYSSFLALMQEKKQKKIKASGMPAKLAGYMIGEVQICAMYQANLPASAEAAGQFLELSDGLSVPGILPRPRQRAFSCLDARKEPKENQGARGTGQVGRVHDRGSRESCHVPGKLPCLGRGLWPRFHSPNGAK